MNKGEIEMNIKPVCLILFISFFIFSSIGCVMSNVSPETETTLTKDYQTQKFDVTPFITYVTWSLNDEVVFIEDLSEYSRSNSSYTLDWNDLSNGHYILQATDKCSKTIFYISVIKPEEIQSETENTEEQFSWNNIRSEWKEKSDKLINGEEK